MRTFFFGDIHGNTDALDACLKYLSELRVDAVYCMGDLVGWLPFGDRSLARMRSLDIPTVAGNHDLLVAGLFSDQPNQPDRMQASAFNAGLLSSSPDAIDYLRGLPLILEAEEFVVVHHSPFHLPKWDALPTIECFNYLDEAALGGCLHEWRRFSRRIIFSGHDHDPAIYELPDSAESPSVASVKIHKPGRSESLTVRLDSRARYWIKAGSVGGPYRDGIPAANCVLFDSTAETVTLSRLPYSTDRLREELASHFFCRNLSTLQKYLALLDSPAANSERISEASARTSNIISPKPS
jgi:predicted phosphodiesterase